MTTRFAAQLMTAGAVLLAIAGTGPAPARAQPPPETAAQRDARMAWWREARFGMFVHWGLYSIPAGRWGERTDYGEWIRHTARIPIEEYDRLVGQFNPVKFDADAWVALAADAGMRYIVITSKHHDGFCLFDSQETDFDMMATPLKRDVLKELSTACARRGVKLCFYHSIMDWHHPDYLPRRDWEAAARPSAGADFDRYVSHMKAQLRELLTNYGPLGVLWFDGEWEATWTHERGVDLYHYVRSLQPSIIINNRVDVLREGMAGFSRDPRAVGDFGTPEQEIPATGLPGVDWETCMTMNRNWGFNAADHDFKSTSELVRMLIDVASKGGNFLLNVGPTAAGEFPPGSVQRLREIGTWMRANGGAIHGTQASPFKTLAWGRCTQRTLPGGQTRLFLHVFDWPADHRLVLPGLRSDPVRAAPLAEVDSRSGSPRTVTRDEDALVIALDGVTPDPLATVIVLDLRGTPDVVEAPIISAADDIFVDTLEVTIESPRPGADLRYTLDGRAPTADSPRVAGPVRLAQTCDLRVRAFEGARALSPVAAATFTQVTPRPALEAADAAAGVRFEYYEGQWDALPDFSALSPAKSGTAADIELSPRARAEAFGFRFRAALRVPRTGVYRFFTRSDDGSRLYVGDQLVVDNDGPHAMRERAGAIALAAGRHPLTVTFFERSGDDALEVLYEGPGVAKQRIPAAELTQAAAALPVPAAAPVAHAVVTPTPRQLAWQALEVSAFVHFGMNTFTDREWGDGTEDPALFNPTDFDAQQWVEVFRDAGFKLVILTAKHHDGFCLWPSRYTSHSVKQSPWRGGNGDVVREVSEACRAAGLKFGVYLSPWDRHEPCYGDSPRYNEHYRNQLTELLTSYGLIHEVWWDGACGEGPAGRKQVYDWASYIEVVRRLQPEAVIFSDAGPDVRWAGNERGFAGETNWSTLRRAEFFPGTPNFAELTAGHEEGTHWVPAECDVSIRPGWFHHPVEDERVKSLSELLEIYYASVGRNAGLLLNVPADRRGRIPERDAARLREWRTVLAETFQTNLATDPPTRQIVDGCAAFNVAVAPGAAFDRVVVQEDIRHGQRIRAFQVEARVGSEWRRISAGTTIGYKRILRCEPVAASAVRVVIRDARAAPQVAALGLYRASAREAAP